PVLRRPVLLPVLRAVPHVRVSPTSSGGTGLRGAERRGTRPRGAPDGGAARGGRRGARELRARAAEGRPRGGVGGSRRAVLAEGRAPRKPLARAPARPAYAHRAHRRARAGGAARRGRAREDAGRPLRSVRAHRLTSLSSSR